MKKVIAFCLLFLSIVSVSTSQTANTAVVTNLSVERFNALINSDKSGVIIDLRTPDEVAKGYIKGATFLDWLSKDNEAMVAKLDKNKTYYIYCAAGGRSGDCAAYMEKKGFKRVYNLEKGFSDWKKKGMPIEVK